MCQREPWYSMCLVVLWCLALQFTPSASPTPGTQDAFQSGNMKRQGEFDSESTFRKAFSKIKVQCLSRVEFLIENAGPAKPETMASVLEMLESERPYSRRRRSLPRCGTSQARMTCPIRIRTGTSSSWRSALSSSDAAMMQAARFLRPTAQASAPRGVNG